MPSTATLHKTAYSPRDHLRPGLPPRNEQERDRARAEIKARYGQPRKKANPQRRIALLRMHDLESLCRASVVPADGGWEYLTAAANHLAFIYRRTADKIAAVVAWCRRFTPSIPPDRAALLAERIVEDPRMPCADRLAWRLGLTMETRTALEITTIGAVDVTKAQRAALRKKMDAEGARRRRAAQRTGRPRGRPSKGKPWEALGISKTTYYERRTKMRRQHSLSTYADDGISSGPPPQPAAPPSPTIDAGDCLTSVGLPDQRGGFVPLSPSTPSLLQVVSP